jgi:hypothetical protein
MIHGALDAAPETWVAWSRDLSTAQFAAGLKAALDLDRRPLTTLGRLWPGLTAVLQDAAPSSNVDLVLHLLRALPSGGGGPHTAEALLATLTPTWRRVLLGNVMGELSRLRSLAAARREAPLLLEYAGLRDAIMNVMALDAAEVGAIQDAMAEDRRQMTALPSRVRDAQPFAALDAAAFGPLTRAVAAHKGAATRVMIEELARDPRLRAALPSKAPALLQMALRPRRPRPTDAEAEADMPRENVYPFFAEVAAYLSRAGVPPLADLPGSSTLYDETEQLTTCQMLLDAGVRPQPEAVNQKLQRLVDMIQTGDQASAGPVADCAVRMMHNLGHSSGHHFTGRVSTARALMDALASLDPVHRSAFMDLVTVVLKHTPSLRMSWTSHHGLLQFLFVTPGLYTPDALLLVTRSAPAPSQDPAAWRWLTHVDPPVPPDVYEAVVGRNRTLALQEQWQQALLIVRAPFPLGPEPLPDDD